jgi:hypothetical protein
VVQKATAVLKNRFNLTFTRRAVILGEVDPQMASAAKANSVFVNTM